MQCSSGFVVLVLVSLSFCHGLVSPTPYVQSAVPNGEEGVLSPRVFSSRSWKSTPITGPYGPSSSVIPSSELISPSAVPFLSHDHVEGSVSPSPRSITSTSTRNKQVLSPATTPSSRSWKDTTITGPTASPVGMISSVPSLKEGLVPPGTIPSSIPWDGTPIRGSITPPSNMKLNDSAREPATAPVISQNKRLQRHAPYAGPVSPKVRQSVPPTSISKSPAVSPSRDFHIPSGSQVIGSNKSTPTVVKPIPDRKAPHMPTVPTPSNNSWRNTSTCVMAPSVPIGKPFTPSGAPNEGSWKRNSMAGPNHYVQVQTPLSADHSPEPPAFVEPVIAPPPLYHHLEGPIATTPSLFPTFPHGKEPAMPPKAVRSNPVAGSITPSTTIMPSTPTGQLVTPTPRLPNNRLPRQKSHASTPAIFPYFPLGKEPAMSPKALPPKRFWRSNPVAGSITPSPSIIPSSPNGKLATTTAIPPNQRLPREISHASPPSVFPSFPWGIEPSMSPKSPPHKRIWRSNPSAGSITPSPSIIPSSPKGKLATPTPIPPNQRLPREISHATPSSVFPSFPWGIEPSMSPKTPPHKRIWRSSPSAGSIAPSPNILPSSPNGKLATPTPIPPNQRLPREISHASPPSVLPSFPWGIEPSMSPKSPWHKRFWRSNPSAGSFTPSPSVTPSSPRGKLVARFAPIPSNRLPGNTSHANTPSILPSIPLGNEPALSPKAPSHIRYQRSNPAAGSITPSPSVMPSSPVGMLIAPTPLAPRKKIPRQTFDTPFPSLNPSFPRGMEPAMSPKAVSRKRSWHKPIAGFITPAPSIIPSVPKGELATPIPATSKNLPRHASHPVHSPSQHSPNSNTFSPKSQIMPPTNSIPSPHSNKKGLALPPSSPVSNKPFMSPAKAPTNSSWRHNIPTKGSNALPPIVITPGPTTEHHKHVSVPSTKTAMKGAPSIAPTYSGRTHTPPLSPTYNLKNPAVPPVFLSPSDSHNHFKGHAVIPPTPTANTPQIFPAAPHAKKLWRHNNTSKGSVAPSPSVLMPHQPRKHHNNISVPPSLIPSKAAPSTAPTHSRGMHTPVSHASNSRTPGLSPVSLSPLGSRHHLKGHSSAPSFPTASAPHISPAQPPIKRPQRHIPISGHATAPSVSTVNTPNVSPAEPPTKLSRKHNPIAAMAPAPLVAPSRSNGKMISPAAFPPSQGSWKHAPFAGRAAAPSMAHAPGHGTFHMNPPSVSPSSSVSSSQHHHAKGPISSSSRNPLAPSYTRPILSPKAAVHGKKLRRHNPVAVPTLSPDASSPISVPRKIRAPAKSPSTFSISPSQHEHTQGSVATPNIAPSKPLPVVWHRSAAAPSLIFPPPPPSKECSATVCTLPQTSTPPGAPCGCVNPMQVELQLGVALYEFFPLVSELALEIAAGVFLKQSQVRIMGANADSQDQEKTVVLLDLVPLQEKFDHETAFLIFERFYKKKVSINRKNFGDYRVVYINYPGLPPAPPSAYSSTVNGSSSGVNGSNKPKPDGVYPYNKHNTKLKTGIIAILAVVAAVAVIFCLGAFWLVFVKLKSRNRPYSGAVEPTLVSSATKRSGGYGGSIISGSMLSSTSMSFASSMATYTGSAKTFTLSELEKATDKFSEQNILGEGGFGRVYRGVLDDGTELAVKVLTRDDQQGGREFIAEVEMLSRLHHRNLVKLIGICTEDQKRCLVYELIPNGSVESHLHGPDRETSPLDWDARIKIALGAARGLAYLHEDSSPRVIHRDFKASNILLEDDFTPKVSDFGLARSASEEVSVHISTKVMGTFGYVAPEYAMTGHLLVKSDVYSYGVVLLELLSGRKPVDMSQPPGQENLVTWARPLLTSREGLETLIDPALGRNLPFDNIARVAAIASMCVQPEVSHRPFMGEVVQALKLVYNDSDASNGGGSCSVSQIDESYDNGPKEGSSRQWTYKNQYTADGSSFVTVDYDSGPLQTQELETERPFSASALMSTSENLTRQFSGSFRRYSSSGPLRFSKTRKYWYGIKGLARGSVSEHSAKRKFGLGSY